MPFSLRERRAGFVLLPLLGLARAIVVPVAVNFLLAVVLASRRHVKLALAAVGIAACALAVVLSRGFRGHETPSERIDSVTD